MSNTNLFVRNNAVKFDGVRFFTSFSPKPNIFLASSLSRRVQTCCCYRETSLKSVTPFKKPVKETSSVTDGVGIFRFLKGKSYLITGATGFLAKVLVEKLLRKSHEIGKIFLLIKSKDQESANKRLYDEIISSDLCKLLKQKYGSSYQVFMKSKLIPVIGDIGEENLGIKSQIAATISDEIDVIISCAGRTTFDDRYDSALNVNTLGPRRLLSFGKNCKKLKLFLHFSTAYVTGKKEGTIFETPLCIGENITSHLNIESEFKLALEAKSISHCSSEETKKQKELGLQRAQHYGWENVYTFTKAMGECVIYKNRGDLPIVIIRPSIIETSYKEPFPSWLQGIRMTAPIILAYGKDHIPSVWGDSQSLVDIIPVDMVVNATIAAMAKHSCCVSDFKVYNVTSTSHANPLRAGAMMDFSRKHLLEYPLRETKKDLERIRFDSSLESYIASVSNTIAKQEREMKYGQRGGGEEEALSMKGKRKLEYFVSLARTYEPYLFYHARFDDTNTRSLFEELSMEEKEMFGFDVRGIDWEDYISNIHLPGLKSELFRRRSS